MPNKWLDYANLSGKSGILRYLKEKGSISVEFKKGKNKEKPNHYRYDSLSLGSFHILEMNRLADEGQGLHSYIGSNKDVKDGYSDLW